MEGENERQKERGQVGRLCIGMVQWRDNSSKNRERRIRGKTAEFEGLKGIREQER